MVIESLRYRIPAAEQSGFRDAWRKALAIVARDIHCLGTEFTQSVEEPQSFVIRILRDSVQGHVEGFRKSPSHAAAFAGVKSYAGLLTSEIHHHRVLE